MAPLSIFPPHPHPHPCILFDDTHKQQNTCTYLHIKRQFMYINQSYKLVPELFVACQKEHKVVTRPGLMR